MWMFAFIVKKKAPALSSGGPVPLRLNLAAGWLYYNKMPCRKTRGDSALVPLLTDYKPSVAAIITA